MKPIKFKKILILVTILALPGFLYYLLRENGKNRYKTLPIFGKKIVSNTFHTKRGKKIPDTIYHNIADFNLLNQNQEQISFSNFTNKVMVFGLFYTTETGFAIQQANKAMHFFSEIYSQNKMVSLLSVTINPKNDKGQLLNKYAKSIKSVAPKWNLLTGDEKSIYNLVQNGLLLDATKIDKEPFFIHSNKFVLVDSKRRIRGYYDCMRKEAIDKLNDEIKVLITEELRNIKDGR
ncbi:MAG: SCO family protein [Sphingobacteriaceae bacterium]|nr:SCO family protein [Sphingobacteriaceae bacterium]